MRRCAIVRFGCAGIICAMDVQNVILTGFMGTGKTTVGRKLAARLGFEFIDTDEVIVARDGRTVAEIFREDGEAAFRAREARVAHDLAQRRGLVVATGGRLMLDAGNAAALGETGAVFCLTARPVTILARLAQDGVRRPLLEVAHPTLRVAELLAERAEGYGRFPQIPTDTRTPDELADYIFHLLGRDVLSVNHPTGQYNIVVGRELLRHVRTLADVAGPVALVSDSNVAPHYAPHLGEVAVSIVVPAGEQHKRLETVNGIYSRLLAAGIDRKGTVVALGGGVVGDLAGFAAATYMRGVDFVQCPTSLLAMVDASVGGKTGVDLPQGKNLVGAFKQPTAVLADVGTLRTLPPVEFAAGMAEVIKHGLIAAPSIFTQLETEDWSAAAAPRQTDDRLQRLITDAIEVKRCVVEEDPFEQGRRAVLNLGHTFGHAIEQVSGYAVRHGEAVALGLVAAAHLSAALGHCDAGLQPRIEQVLTRVGLPTRMLAALEPDALYRAMGSDKKKAAGRLRFVLLHDVGDVFVTDEVEKTAVLATLRACREA